MTAGGAGAPPGAKAPARSWLTDEAECLDEKRGPAPEEERRDGAPRGATHRKMRALTTGCADWRAVPLSYRGVDSPCPPCEGTGNKGVPGAFFKEYGRRSVGFLTIEYECVRGGNNLTRHGRTWSGHPA